ncbi:kynurenine 3-monooxygenase-like [Selaginella moellendorffii]|uniref:kynurenine 3-monooxygenase-like n=1 Tax=Selaginella moellendorffii TaxID=88036 RepID=UPI000D1CD1A4|nr:kynurenine 3-monooxygenase-like [Selaginella moellendorffii]|eukprot:XP_024530254.1 kynurenine 3-monooxygenase-like [Selaginella moellendorffii]
MASPPHAVIVGAGPAGCLTAIYCIRRGFHVHLFDKRTPPATADRYVGSDSRSYTMLLTCRAIEALQAAQVQVPSSLMGPLVGGCVHLPNKKTRVFTYTNGNSASYGISRNGLVWYLQRVLLQRYASHVSTHFEYELAKIDDDKCVAVFQSTREDGDSIQVEYGLLVGADGVSSKTRSEMLRLEETRPEAPPLTFKYTRNPESYKSFYVSPALAKSSPLYVHHNYVQSWPALNMLLVGMADGSFWGGSKNSELLNATSGAAVERIFRETAPEVYDLLCQQNSDFSEDYAKQPRISFGGAVVLSRFHRRNIVLVGDAAHAMFPSYGTGCNALLWSHVPFKSIMQKKRVEDTVFAVALVAPVAALLFVLKSV